MMYLQVNGLTKRFGAELILSNIKLEVKDKDRIAIVGRNGAGKSTLLKIIAGELSLDEGEIHKPKDITIGYLAQQMDFDSTETIWDEMLKIFQNLLQQEKKLRKLEEKMGDPDVLENHQEYDELLHQYDQLQEAFTQAGGYLYESEIKAVLNGLDFPEEYWDKKIHTLSGGQKTRLSLGKLLLSKPDLLLLDEPTNHLDIHTLTWLESYLMNYPGAVVIVSHDRYFLDKTVDIVYEISRTRSQKYHGNYSNYLIQKANKLEKEQRQAEIKKTEEFIQRNIARASTTKRAQSRRKQLERLERIDQPLTDHASAKFSFTIERKTGNDVLKIGNLSFRFHEQQDALFQNLTLHLQRGDRVALAGPNGVGKSTLLKTIVGQLQPVTGEILLGANVKLGYYEQEQTQLHMDKTVLTELWDDYPLMNEKDIRTILGNFLFSGDDVLRPVSELSGGEKARLALAKLMMEKANFLLLDEPTNHLDLDSKEILESALIDYPGTILFVSHDRYFINKIATQVFEMQANHTTLYLGNYDYYLEKKQEEKELEEIKEKEQQEKVPTPTAKTQFELDKEAKKEQRRKKRRMEEIEKEIEQLEQQLEENEHLLYQPEYYEDHQKAQKIISDNEQIQNKIEVLFEEFATLEES